MSPFSLLSEKQAMPLLYSSLKITLLNLLGIKWAETNQLNLRSRCKWVEKGDNNSLYCSGLGTPGQLKWYENRKVESTSN